MSGFDGVRLIGGGEQGPRLIGEGAATPPTAEGTGEGEGGGFDAVLEAMLEVDRLGTEVKDKAEALARGEPVEVHDLMIAMGKSEVAFNLMVQVRNKVVEAWETLSRSVV